MRRARRPVRIAALAAAVAVAACAGDDEPAGTATGPPSTSRPADEPFVSAGTATDAGAGTTTTEPQAPARIGLVAPSAADDVSFTQSMVEALGRLGVEFEVAGGTAAGDAAAALERLATEGVDLVVAHGTEFAVAARDAAAAAPDVAFAWGPAEPTGGASDDPANLFVYGARADEGAYVLGAVAAAVAAGDPIGIVGSVEVADARRYVDGFVAGAAGSSVDVSYIDSFDDAALAGEAARVVADRGAVTMSATSQMSVGALAVARERSLPWFANLLDQSTLAPDLVVASQVYRWEIAIGAILDAVAAGEPAAAPFELTLANGGLEVVFNEAFGLDPAARVIGDETLAGLLDGSVVTGVGG